MRLAFLSTLAAFGVLADDNLAHPHGSSPPLSQAVQFPLRTQSRWIVEKSTGKRVKLACVNWPAHMETQLPEVSYKIYIYLYI